MAVKVFLFGRPGSGKSAVFRHIEKYLEEQYEDWPAVHFSDYEILQQMFQFEKLFQVAVERRKFLSSEHDGFDVRDFSVLDTALKELEKQVRYRWDPNKDEIIAIEFARDDYTKALKQFMPGFLQNAHFLFIEVSMKTCIRRIHERISQPISADDHFVSENILQSYYSQQQPPRHLERDYGIDASKIHIIHNGGSEQDLIKKVKRLVDTIIKTDPHSSAIEECSRRIAKKPYPVIPTRFNKVHV